jgi:RimJ/RimL family protein N-acetyltransferase
MIPILHSGRVSLREWRANEIEAMHGWLADPDVMRYLTWGAKTFQDSVRHLDLCIAEQRKIERIRYYLAVELRTGGKVIGDAGFEWINQDLKEGDIGYFLLPAYWGIGLGTECVRLILQLAFGHCGALVMRASCDERNLASEGVMKKCGMQRLKHLEQPGRRSYGIARAQWLRGLECEGTG